ncbi:hypothetical protein GGI11_003794 [Coemansia sp. RSA 2049]|nr:hypothetical protein GGI11_003794 [Coemansia sp. RSA 2049]
MPRSPSNNTMLPLLRKLAQKVGGEQAQNELRWLTEHVREELTDIAHSSRSSDGRGAGTHLGARIWRDQPAPSVEEIERDNQRLTSIQWAWLRQAVKDRVEHNKPLQYIIGAQPFGRANITVRPPVLIPRWETEEWTIRLAELIATTVRSSIGGNGETAQKRPLNILDACTGSGCISLGLASELPPDTIDALGVDVSPEAVALAMENLALNQALLNGNTVRFRRLDLMRSDAAARLAFETEAESDESRRASGPPAWDMIVSNPPYVTPAEYEGLDPDVREWEDKRALVPLLPPHPGAEDDPSGLAFVARLAALAGEMGMTAPAASVADSSIGNRLPRLVVEIGGELQAEAACQIMRDHRLYSTEVWKDMAGRSRVVLGYAKPKQGE